LAPGFSRVVLAVVTGNGFNRFPAGRETKPVKRLAERGCALMSGCKQTVMRPSF
jgi:hypothetical protein